MSEIIVYPCPCCGGDATFSDDMEDRRAEVHCIKCGVGIQVKGYPALKKALEKWNTRKPMERIIERLEHEKQEDNELRKFHKNNGTKTMEGLYVGKTNAFKDAIEIVKEEGGIE